MEETNICPICNNNMMYSIGFNPMYGDYDKRTCKGLNHILILSFLKGKAFKAEIFHKKYQYSWDFKKNKLKITDLENLINFKSKNFFIPDFYNPNLLNKLQLLVSFN